MSNCLNIQNIIKQLQKPEPFAKSTALFWDDPPISKQMLKAHLDPDIDAASRKHETIDRTVEWITKELALEKGIKILDLGCGPGLYCTRFAGRGFDVTGIDFSQRSIQYAKDHAQSNKLKIEYIYKDYLVIEYDNVFDLVTLIYYDFGVFSDQDRDPLLRRIYSAMKPGGHFVFDVHTPVYIASMTEEKTWEYEEKDFWRSIPYVLLTEKIKYPEHNALLTQYCVIDKNQNSDIYRIWDRAYTKESMSKALSDVGFKKIRFYEDLVGKKYSEKSLTMGIVAGKSLEN